MSPFKRNVTRVVIFSTIVLISAVISTAIYYLKTKTNEQTQNQLQFRQLNIASTSIDQSIRKLINISDYFKKNILCDATNMTPGVVDDKKWFRTCKSVVENRINQINQSEDLKSIKLVDIFSPKATDESSHADIGSVQLSANRPFRQSLITPLFATLVCIKFKDERMCRQYNRVNNTNAIDQKLPYFIN